MEWNANPKKKITENGLSYNKALKAASLYQWGQTPILLPQNNMIKYNALAISISWDIHKRI